MSSTPVQTATRRQVTKHEKIEAAQTSSSGRSRSPLSPSRESRIREREEISGLNTRLANYIDTVRRLETENQTLRVKISKSEESFTQERMNIRASFEDEMSSLRGSLNEVSRERARLEIDNGKLRARDNEREPRLKELERENERLSNTNRSLEKLSSETEAKLITVTKERDMFATELANAKKEMETLKKQLKSAREQLEKEVMRRVDLENSSQALQEKFDFEQSLINQTLNETKRMQQTEIEEIERKVDEEANNRVQAALEEMRSHHEATIEQYRREKEDYYMNQLREMKNYADKKDKDSSKIKSEMVEIRRRNESLTSEISSLNNKLREAEKRYEELDELRRRDQSISQERIEELEREMSDLRKQMGQLLVDFEDLQDEKLNLDVEIAAYRKMLESEEERLHITPSPARKRKMPGGGTPMTSASGSRIVKRRKVDVAESYTSETVQSTTPIGVEIVEADPMGYVVKLENHTDKDISMGNYSIRRTSGQDEDVFKFPSRFSLKSKACVTVFSAKAPKAVHSSPESLIAKNIQKWSTSDNYTTVLLDSGNEEVATRVSKRVVTDSIDLDEEDEQGEKCIIC